MRLFSPLQIGTLLLPNRIVFMPHASGHALSDGRISPALEAFYVSRAEFGAGLVVLEAGWPLRPGPEATPHIALYDGRALPGLRTCTQNIRDSGACALIQIDQPLRLNDVSDRSLLELLPAAWLAAAQCALRAGFDGIMLSCADGGPFHQLLSPLHNRREGTFNGSLERRAYLLLATIERLRARLGWRVPIGVRLLADECTPGGLTLQDARVLARRLATVGVNLIDVTAGAGSNAPMARFPGWLVPLAAAVRSIGELPIMVGDLNDDPAFAESVLDERSADLLALGDTLRSNPTWPRRARAQAERR